MESVRIYLNNDVNAQSKVFLHFLDNGASSALILTQTLFLPEATVYRVLNRLKKLKIIKPALKMEKHIKSKGGPRPEIFDLFGSEPYQVYQARNLHIQLEDENYNGKTMI